MNEHSTHHVSDGDVGQEDQETVAIGYPVQTTIGIDHEMRLFNKFQPFLTNTFTHARTKRRNNNNLGIIYTNLK